MGSIGTIFIKRRTKIKTMKEFTVIRQLRPTSCMNWLARPGGCIEMVTSEVVLHQVGSISRPYVRNVDSASLHPTSI